MDQIHRSVAGGNSISTVRSNNEMDLSRDARLRTARRRKCIRFAEETPRSIYALDYHSPPRRWPDRPCATARRPEQITRSGNILLKWEGTGRKAVKGVAQLPIRSGLDTARRGSDERRRGGWGAGGREVDGGAGCVAMWGTRWEWGGFGGRDADTRASCPEDLVWPSGRAVPCRPKGLRSRIGLPRELGRMSQKRKRELGRNH